MWRLGTAFLLALAACANASGNGLPDDAVVLPESSIDTLLRQCSRGAPAAGEAGWQPGADQIAALEAALPAALTARDDQDWSRFPGDWRRQYVGLVRGGRRYVYGNFFPRRTGDDIGPGRWRTEPVLVCDGGPAFFGVEYDVEAGRITRLDFNGMA
jgi:hypothetical protein